jgi:hypothetical protein
MSNFFCVGNNKIQPMSSTGNQSVYNLKKLAMRLNKPAKINYNNLNMNLATKLVLTDVNVIQDNITGQSPASIPSACANQAEFIADPADPTNFIESHFAGCGYIPGCGTHTEFIADPTNPDNFIETRITSNNSQCIYTINTIDPSGQLFGETECGLDNWKKHLVPLYPPL